MEKKDSSKLKIAIIHPDLGIGGAERLVVDAAMELASHGHNVSFPFLYMGTSCHDIFFTGSMPYVHISDASLLLSVFCLCGHHLMLS